jgi:hypothetical protein
MVGSRLVRSLAKPGGNTTGVSILATELDGKRQDILIEAVPGLRRMVALADTDTTTPEQLRRADTICKTYLPEAVLFARIGLSRMQGIDAALRKRGCPPVEDLKAGKKRGQEAVSPLF